MSLQNEVTASGLPVELWQPLLAGARELDIGPLLSPANGRGPVLIVVVPHPDDETLGAGGLLHRCVAAGAEVVVVFVTDGAAGYPGVAAGQAEELARLRREESRKALELLGLDADLALFLDLPDGRVGLAESALAGWLQSLLGDRRADLCLAPWPLDPHPDHQAVGRAAASAATAAAVALWQYPIWMRHSIQPDDSRVPLEQLRVFRLEPGEQAVKRAATEAHGSQLRSPFPGYGPVLPEHVLELFADGYEPFFVPAEADPTPGDL